MLVHRAFAAAQGRASPGRKSSAANAIHWQVRWLTDGGSHVQQPVYTTLPPHLSRQTLATKHSMIVQTVPPLPPLPPRPGAPPPPACAPPAPPLPACAP